MLVVLVRLNGDARKRRVAGDVVRLAEVSVAGGKSAVEQLEQVYLAAGGGQRQEVEVVDVDIAVDRAPGRAPGRARTSRRTAWHLREPYFSMVPIAVSPSMLAFSRLMSQSDGGHEGQILVYLHQA